MYSILLQLLQLLLLYYSLFFYFLQKCELVENMGVYISFVDLETLLAERGILSPAEIAARASECAAADSHHDDHHDHNHDGHHHD